MLTAENIFFQAAVLAIFWRDAALAVPTIAAVTIFLWLFKAADPFGHMALSPKTDAEGGFENPVAKKYFRAFAALGIAELAVLFAASMTKGFGG